METPLLPCSWLATDCNCRVTTDWLTWSVGWLICSWPSPAYSFLVLRPAGPMMTHFLALRCHVTLCIKFEKNMFVYYKLLTWWQQKTLSMRLPSVCSWKWGWWKSWTQTPVSTSLVSAPIVTYSSSCSCALRGILLVSVCNVCPYRCILNLKLSNLDQTVMVWFIFRKCPVWISSRTLTILSEGFFMCEFPQSFQTDVGIVPYIKPHLLPSMSFSIH
jgi:hypothetical protein